MTDGRRSVPKYVALAGALRQIVSGLDERAALPTERDLMVQFGVSRMTVRRALSELVDGRLVYQVQGSGTYVAPAPKVAKSTGLTSFSEDMRTRGCRPGSRILESARCQAGEKLGAALKVASDASVLLLRRLRLADDEPMALELAHFVMSRIDWDLVHLGGSLYSQFADQGISLGWADQRIEAVRLTAEQAALLDQQAGAPALMVRRLCFTDRGEAFESTETLYRGDRYSFELTMQRVSAPFG